MSFHNPIYNYIDIFENYFFNRGNSSSRKCPDYILVFVFSGELIIRRGQRIISIREGEHIFLRKDINITLERLPLGDDRFRSVFMGLNSSMLQEFCIKMNMCNIPSNIKDFEDSVIELPLKPYLGSIYYSMQPYLMNNIHPESRIVEIKMMQTILSLLLTDERFYPCLFDSLHDFNISTSFYNANKYNILFPHCRIFPKKLETTCITMQECDEICDTYIEVSYRDELCMVKILEDKYGFTNLSNSNN